MINWKGIIIKTKEELERAIANLPEADKQSLRNEFDGGSKKLPLTQVEKDYIKYERRANIKDKIIAEMATENMGRIRSGVWTVPDLISLTQDQEIKGVLDDVHSLSFELAVNKIRALSNPIITQSIKKAWIAKLTLYFFNE